MPSTDAVRVYKQTDAFFQVGITLFALVFGGTGIGLIAAYQQTGWAGVAGGSLITALVAGSIAVARMSSVTIHDQGIVVRQHLRREFIPWQAVVAISPPESFAGSYGPNPKGPGTWRTTVCICIDTGARYIEKWKLLHPTTGSVAHVNKIAAEMQEFRRREHEARAAAAAAAAADSLPARRPQPVTPVAPADDRDDRDFGPGLGKALW
jgi:hypothetical protein